MLQSIHGRSLAIQCQSQGGVASVHYTPSRAKLFHEEPEAGNLHIRHAGETVLCRYLPHHILTPL
jgi:hypothetical protein